MEIIYTQESVEGEPGPILYWRGRQDEYLRLLCDLHRLGLGRDVTLRLEDLSYVRLVGLRSYEMVCSEGSDCAGRVEAGLALTRLGVELWRQFLHRVLSVTFSASFVFQEFSGVDAPVSVIMRSSA